MEPITGSGAICVLRYECHEPIFCISALNCPKMRLLSYQISSNRARQYLPIERGSICINGEVARLLSAQIGEMEPISGSGAYCVLRQECQEPIFCMSALNCPKMRSLSYQISAYRAGQYLPIERCRICLNSEVARLLSAQIVEMEPISGSGAYCVLRQECQEPIFCISALNCAKMRSLQYQISSYRARQNLPIERGSICLKSEVARLLSAQIAAMEPITGSGAYCVLRYQCQEPIFCMSALNLICAKILSLSYHIFLERLVPLCVVSA